MNIEDWKHGKIIQCMTDEQIDRMVKYLDDIGITHTDKDVYKKDLEGYTNGIGLNINEKKDRVMYSGCKYYASQGFVIIPFEDIEDFKEEIIEF